MALTRENATLAVTSTPAGLPSIPAGCESALIQADTANIRYTADGSTVASASVGLRLINGANPTSITGNLSKFSFVAETGSPNLNIVYQTEQ